MCCLPLGTCVPQQAVALYSLVHCLLHSMSGCVLSCLSVGLCCLLVSCLLSSAGNPVSDIEKSKFSRSAKFADRITQQIKTHAFPTSSIGSFPQTPGKNPQGPLQSQFCFFVISLFHMLSSSSQLDASLAAAMSFISPSLLLMPQEAPTISMGRRRSQAVARLASAKVRCATAQPLHALCLRLLLILW